MIPNLVQDVQRFDKPPLNVQRRPAEEEPKIFDYFLPHSPICCQFPIFLVLFGTVKFFPIKILEIFRKGRYLTTVFMEMTKTKKSK